MKPGAVQIGRNEPCPCGSGKRYMDCCLNTKYLITYNYRNQAVLIDKNEINKNLRRIIALNGSLNNFLKKSLYGEDFKVDTAIDYIRKTYEIVDLSLQEVGKFTSCSKGCSACCNRQPLITWTEAEYIKRYIKNNLSSHEIEVFLENLFKKIEQKPCPLLSQSHECTVYEARPFNCRSYLVFSDPLDCFDKINDPLRFTDAVLDLAGSIINKIALLIQNRESEHSKKSIGFWLKNIN